MCRAAGHLDSCPGPHSVAIWRMSQHSSPKYRQACPHRYMPCEIVSFQLYTERACTDTKHWRHTAYICEVNMLHLQSAACAQARCRHTCVSRFVSRGHCSL